MKITLARLLDDDTRLFQQVIVDVSTDGIPLEVKVNIHVLAEPGRVVVSIGFGIAKRFQNSIRLQQDILDSMGIEVKTSQRWKYKKKKKQETHPPIVRHSW